MTGKQKCKILKQIRRQIADANGIEYLVEECRHKGKCSGTCPRCEWEVRELEKALEKRRLSGKKVALAGISAGFLLTACSPLDGIHDLFNKNPGTLEGDVPYMETDGAVAGETETDVPVVKGLIVEESLAGEPVLDETETELPLPGELAEETDGMLVYPESESEEFEIAGGIPPLETESEDSEVYRLEGDVVYIAPEEEE